MQKQSLIFKLTIILINVLFVTTTLSGQSCDGLGEHINNQVQNIISGTGTSNAIFTSYSSAGNSTWATSEWTGQVDFSGIAFDDSRTLTLISPRHVLMANHYQRGIGDVIVFHDSSGNIHSATLIAKQNVPGGTNPDITVGLLDVDVPVKYYKVLPPQTNWAICLNNRLVISTHHTRDASIRKVSSTSGLYINFSQSSAVPASYYAPVVSGNSGNPSFLMINGEPILISTFTFSNGTGPFFANLNNFNDINSIMTSLGGGYQLEAYPCPSDFSFSGNGGLTGLESGSAYYETDGQIESTQQISGSGHVGYDSAITIDLLPDFEVVLGGEFRTYIDGCPN